MGKSKFILTYISIMIISISAVVLFAWIDINSSEKAFAERIKQTLKSQKRLYEIHTEKTFKSLEQLASVYAGDKRIQQLFLNGVDAVKREGGGKGGVEAARFRDELYDLVGETWQEIRHQYDARQLHFHMAPGSTSYLRVHRPEKFGDNMDNVRHTIVHTNATLQKTHGFETGRVASGLRGVVPVFATDPKTGRKRHIGALEAGMSLLPIITVLNGEHIGTKDHSHSINAVALLSDKHLKKNVWPEFLEKLHRKNLFIKDFYIEAATNPGKVKELFSHKEVIDKINIPGVHILKGLEPPIAFISITLHDFKSSSEQSAEGVGYILIWFDITWGLEELQAAVNKKIIMAFLVEMFILTFTYFVLSSLFSYHRREVELNALLVKQKTEAEIQKTALLESKERLNNVAESSGNLVWESDSNHILTYLSPSLEYILGYYPEEISGKKIFDLLLPNETERVEKVFTSSAQNKQNILALESVHIHKNGEERTLVTSAIPLISKTGECIGYRGLSLDITEQKCVALLHHIQQNNMNFVSDFSNILNRLVHTIRRSAHFGITESNTISIEKMLECFNEITHNTNKMIRILADIRDLTRIEPGYESKGISTVVKELQVFQNNLDKSLSRSINSPQPEPPSSTQK